MATASRPRAKRSIRAKSAPAKQASHYFADVWNGPDRKKIPGSMYPTQNGAGIGDPAKLKRWRFKPDRSDVRFRVIYGYWSQSLVIHGDEIETFKHDNYVLPRHALDLQDPADFSTEAWDFPENVMTREEGFKVVAEYNAEKLAEIAGKQPSGVYKIDHWAMLVELGELPSRGVADANAWTNGLGTLNCWIERVIRLVHPTDDEVRQCVEGGAA